MMGLGLYAKLPGVSVREADALGIERKVYCANRALRIFFPSEPPFIQAVPSGSKDANPELVVDDPKPDHAYVLIVGSDHPYWWLAGWSWGNMLSELTRRTELLPIHLLQRIAKERT